MRRLYNSLPPNGILRFSAHAFFSPVVANRGSRGGPVNLQVKLECLRRTEEASLWKTDRYVRKILHVNENYDVTSEWSAARSHPDFADVLLAMRVTVVNKLFPVGAHAEVVKLQVAVDDKVRERP